MLKVVQTRTRQLATLAVLACIIVAFSIYGCSDSETETVQKAEDPFAGLEIAIDAPQGQSFAVAWQPLLDEWSARTGATFRLREYDWPVRDSSLGEFFQTPKASTATARRGLLVFPLTELAGLDAAQQLAPIPENQLASDSLGWLDFLHGLREQVSKRGRQPTVVPLSAPVLACYYRRDLLETAGLSPPATWDDYQKLIDTLGEWAPGLTVVEPWGEEYRATTFFARSTAFAKHPSNYSLFFDIESGQPLIGSPAFVRSLEVAQQALAKMPEKVRSMTPNDCRREFLAGKAAMAICLETAPGNPPLPFGPLAAAKPHGGATAADAAKSERPESMRVGICRLPGARDVFNNSTGGWEATRDDSVNQPALTGFGGLCAGVSSKASAAEQQAAWDILKSLTGTDLPLAFPTATKSLCRESQISEAAAWLGTKLTAGERHQYLTAVATCLKETQVVVELPVVGRAAFRAALSAEIGKVLTGEIQPEPALAATAKRWQEIAAGIGIAAVRDSYRRSLALPALPPSGR